MIFKNSKERNLNKNLGKSQLYTFFGLPRRLASKAPRNDARHENLFSIYNLPFTFSGFTLAEVLVALGIIGVVAAMTIPTLMNKTQDLEYKTAYKQAYSDLNQAFAQAINDQSLTPRISLFDGVATASEWNVIKSAFKVSKECTPAKLYSCWLSGDSIGSQPVVNDSSSFIDASGRSWAQYDSAENIYLVDINGFKPPNRFGKDRWIFTLRNADNTRTSSGFPTRVGMFSCAGGNGDNDIMTTSSWCSHPPCYYYSWLYK